VATSYEVLVKRIIPMLAVALTLLAAGCARPQPLPPAPRALDGQRIMLLPARAGSPASLDAELAFWLGDRAPAVEWILPAELQQMVDRQPGWRVRLIALPRDIADPGRSPYVPDPTYGEIRRLGAVADALLALMPVAVRETAGPEGAVLELTAAVVDVRVGQVLWLGTVRSGAIGGAAGDGIASAAEALAQALFPQ
jgi:hypothetical protein